MSRKGKSVYRNYVKLPLLIRINGEGQQYELASGFR